jgi:hypothetical protein
MSWDFSKCNRKIYIYYIHPWNWKKLAPLTNAMFIGPQCLCDKIYLAFQLFVALGW